MTASGGGVDPHITPEAAAYQAARVAAARNLPVDQVRTLIERHIERSGAIIGAPARVNVLKLNLALDEEKPVAAPARPAEPAKAANTPARATPAATGTADPSPPGVAMAEEVVAIKSRVGEIAGQLEKLGKQIESIAQSRPAAVELPGLKPIEVKLAGMVEEARKIPLLIDRVDGLSGRVSAADDTLKQLQAQLRETRLAIQPVASQALASTDRNSRPGGPAATVDTAARSTKAVIDLGPGVAAFNKGDYAAACRPFGALGQELSRRREGLVLHRAGQRSDDKQWTGETEELVDRGVEREKAGTPPAADIDAAFSDLTRTNGKDWLAFYRRRASQ